MRRILVVLAVALGIAVAPGLESPASALSCLAPPLGVPIPDPYEGDYDAIVEGVPLSGPGVDGSLDTPARFFVTKWIRGRGPRVVPVITDTDTSVGPYTMVTPGLYRAHPGQVRRLFADRDRYGILSDNPCLFGDPRPRPRSPLRHVEGSDVRTAAGARAWRAHAQRGPAGLHCVALHPEGRHTGGAKECEAGRPLLAVQHEGATEVRSSAIVLGGRGIRSVALRTPDGVLVRRPRRDGEPILVVLPGRVDAAEVRARVTLAGGGVRWLRPVGFPSEVVPDPELGRPWASAVDDGFDFAFSGAVARSVCVGAHQLPPRHGIRPDPIGAEIACGDTRHDPYFFAARGVAPVQEGAGGDVRPEPVRTVVLGAASRAVSEVVVREPGGGERRLKPGAGGQFLAVYPAAVAPGELEVVVVFRNGSTVSHRGRAGANLRR